MKAVAERFIRYARITTTSDPKSDNCPSTRSQLDLAKVLMEELLEMGMDKVNLNSDGYLWATLPANTDKKAPVIGFLAHMDTSPDFSGENVNPQIIEKYDGDVIILNKDLDINLDPADFPELNNYLGQDLIVTDGTTLLGADDKAGIAEIMEALKYLTDHPEIEHGTIKVAFTPDEEIGRGADKFPVEDFGADFAYTLDGGPVGELEYENFNAAGAIVRLHGRNVHPGTAKDKMINAIQLGIDFHSMLATFDRPEHTEGKEGFYHLMSFTGNVENAVLNYIIRDHNKRIFNDRKQRLLANRKQINKRYGRDVVDVEISDQYYNMREMIEPNMHIIDLAKEAMIDLDIKPVIKAIRGGTDGSKLSFMGLPCPNIFSGGHNFHGKFEFIPIPSMEKAVSVIIQIAKKAVI